MTDRRGPCSALAVLIDVAVLTPVHCAGMLTLVLDAGARRWCSTLAVLTLVLCAGVLTLVLDAGPVSPHSHTGTQWHACNPITAHAA